MGFLSNWWNGSSAGDSAPDTGAEHVRRKTSMETKPDVWRSVFNPGSNPNVKNVGSSYYDNVKDKAKEPTTWDMILQGETRRKSFSDLDTNKDGYIDRSDLQTAAITKLDVEKIFAEADTNRDGKIDRREFAAVLDRYFSDRHT